jgi:hypothetical protein
MVEKNMGLPPLVKAFEHHILHNMIFENLAEIPPFVEIGKKSELFSDRFYDILF